MEILLGILCVLVLIAIILIILFRPRPGGGVNNDHLLGKIDGLQSAVREDFKISRSENSNLTKDNRQELNAALKDFRAELSEALRSKFDKLKQKQKDLPQRTVSDLKDFQESFSKNVDSFNNLQREKFAQLED